MSRLVSLAAVAAMSPLARAAVEPLSVRGSHILVGDVRTPMAGNGLFWSNTGWGAERFYDADVVATLNSDWGARIVRAAMGVDEDGGYLEDPVGNQRRVETVVDAAIDNDMYVIIDWHTHHAEDYRSQAIAFFTEMAERYAGYPNVIYEIYNEPLQISWSGVIKPYAEAVISAIRSIDPRNLILVGTPSWSQDARAAANDPIVGHSNVAYSLHFYAGTHKGWLRRNAQDALDSGVALLVSEWGTVNADGDGRPDVASTNEWVAWMKENRLIHLNWSVHDKNEGASVVRPGASSDGGWSDSDLTESGKLVRSIIREYNDGGDGEDGIDGGDDGGDNGGNEGGGDEGGGNGGGDNGGDDEDDGGGNADPCVSAAAVIIPARIQAEEYCDHDSVRIEQTSDNGGGQNIAYIENDDWVEYKVNVSLKGAYVVKIRTASDTDGGSIEVFMNGSSIGGVDVPNTGGWQTWKTMAMNVNLQSTGEQILRLNFNGRNGAGLMNVNWIEVSITAPTNRPTSITPTLSPTSQPMAAITTGFPTSSPTPQPVAKFNESPTFSPTPEPITTGLPTLSPTTRPVATFDKSPTPSPTPQKVVMVSESPAPSLTRQPVATATISLLALAFLVIIAYVIRKRWVKRKRST